MFTQTAAPFTKLVVHTTGHDSEGNAVYLKQSPFKPVGPGIGMIYGTTTNEAVDTNSDADLSAISRHNPLVAGLIPKQGCTVLMAEFPPGCDSSHKTHRTMSVDIGVMIEGEVECHLDSGEIRLIRQGEILIQRGTKHFWMNPSQTEKARMLCFVLPSKPVQNLAD